MEFSNQLTPFLSFNRAQWAELRKSVPLKLTEQDLKPLLGFNEELSLDEVSTIYLPLTRLINYYIDFSAETMPKFPILSVLLAVWL